MTELYTVEEEFIPVYRVRYPDGSLSNAFNKTRAHEFARRLNNGETDPRIGFEPINAN